MQHLPGSPLGVGQIHITVGDIDASVGFYRDQIGAQFLFDVPGQDMAFLQIGGVRLYLGHSESSEFHSRPVLYLTVEDIETSYESMSDRGIAFAGPPEVVHRDDDHELWVAFTRDPDGNALAIMQERAPAVPMGN